MSAAWWKGLRSFICYMSALASIHWLTLAEVIDPQVLSAISVITLAIIGKSAYAKKVEGQNGNGG